MWERQSVEFSSAEVSVADPERKQRLTGANERVLVGPIRLLNAALPIAGSVLEAGNERYDDSLNHLTDDPIWHQLWSRAEHPHPQSWGQA